MTIDQAYELSVYEYNKMMHKNRFKSTLDIIQAFSTISVAVSIYNNSV